MFFAGSDAVRIILDKIQNKNVCQHYSIASSCRLREGIKAAPENWTNCSMFVQDLVRPDINITAEVPKEAAENFQQMCQQFVKKCK